MRVFHGHHAAAAPAQRPGLPCCRQKKERKERKRRSRSRSRSASRPRSRSRSKRRRRQPEESVAALEQRPGEQQQQQQQAAEPLDADAAEATAWEAAARLVASLEADGAPTEAVQQQEEELAGYNPEAYDWSALEAEAGSGAAD